MAISPHRRTTIELLPVEVLQRLYRHLCSPADLFSLIRSSRHFNQIFQSLSFSLQTSLIAQVACNAFHPAVLPIVLLIAVAEKNAVVLREELNESYQPQDSDDEKSSRKRRYGRIPERNKRMHIYPYLQEVFIQTRRLVDKQHGQPASCNNGPERIIGRNRTRLIAVCRLWSIVEWFIGDYCEKKSMLLQDLAVERKKRKNAQKANKSKSKLVEDCHENINSDITTGRRIEKGSLSHREYGRLQRGFLLFELHRQLFSPFCGDDEEKAIFIGCLNYMELAELRTVYEYLMEEVAKVADTQEMFAYSCFIREIELRKKRNIEDNNTEANNKIEAEFQAIDERKSRIQPLRHYSVDRYQDRKHAYLVELGLPFCRNLLARMTVRQQTAILWLCRKRRRRISLNQILHATRRRDWASQHLTPHDEDSIRIGLHKLDALLDHGRPERLLDWLSRLEADQISPSSPKRTKERLLLHKRIFTNYAWRQLGWFIWDEWRFKYEWDKDIDSTASTKSASETNEKKDRFWKCQLSVLYHIWLRDQYQHRVVKIQRESLEQTLSSLEVTDDCSLPRARGIRIFIDDDDSSVADQDSESVKAVDRILQESLELESVYQHTPFKEWLKSIDYRDLNHGYQTVWNRYTS